MKYCPNCGEKITKGQKFCPECGEKLSQTIVEEKNIDNSDKQKKQGYKPSSAFIITLSALFLFLLLVLVGVQEANNKNKTTNSSTVIAETTTNGTTNTSAVSKETTNTSAVSEETTSGTTTTTTTTTKTTTTKITTTLSAADQKKKEAKEYKKSCKKYKYKKVLRNYEKYYFKRAKWFGKVVQVIDSKSFRLSVGCSKNRFASGGYVCSNDIYVNYYGNTRVIEDDMITVYGEMYGVQTYTTVLGASRTIPEFKAEYITIK